MKNIVKLTLVLGTVSSLLSCGSSAPSGPADTSFTMWHKVLSSNDLPDTLYAGQIVTFQVAIGDSDGDPVSAALLGLPPGTYNISSSGDTAFVTMNLVADSLVFDSEYSVQVSATDGGTVDSLTLSYSFRVIDTTRLGGIRKLMTGMWWIEYENDTIIKIKDTANVTIITKDTIVHHKYSTVKGVGVAGNDVYYYIETADTILPVSGAPTINGMLLRHNSSRIGYTIPPNSWFSDSIRVKAYDLPLATGKSWQTFNASGDTSMRVLFGPIGVKLHVNFSFDGESQIPGTTEFQFGGALRTCFEISNTTNSNAAIISDTTIVLQFGLLTDTLFHETDTIMTSRTKETGSQYLNPEFSIPLWSYSVQAKCDSNHVNNVVERDTTRKGTFVSTYYDARRQITIIQ
jgi:hypothetical protein